MPCEAVRGMPAAAAKQGRRGFPFGAVVPGRECGGSGAFSGITANPSVGLVADWLVGEGGTVILTGTTQMIGTSRVLERRSGDEGVAREAASRIAAAEGRTLQDAAGEIKGLMLRVLDGEKTRAEPNRQDGILCLHTVTPAFWGGPSCPRGGLAASISGCWAGGNPGSRPSYGLLSRSSLPPSRSASYR